MHTFCTRSLIATTPLKQGIIKINKNIPVNTAFDYLDFKEVKYLAIYFLGSLQLRHFHIQCAYQFQNLWGTNKAYKPRNQQGQQEIPSVSMTSAPLRFEYLSFKKTEYNNLSSVPFVNQVPAFLLLSTSSLIDWTSRATCSSATFKWATKGFNSPDASFSVFPAVDTNNSHLPERKKP